MSLRAIILLLVLFIGVLFESVRTGQGVAHPFLTGHEEWFRGYIYNVCEHIKFITITILMWKGTDPNGGDWKIDRAFLGLACLDFLDYLICGNNVWYSITLIPHGDGYGLIIPFSMNLFSLIFFAWYSWKVSGQQV